MATSTRFQLFLLSTLFAITSAFSNLRACLDGSCMRSNQTIDMRNDSRNTICRPLNIIVGGSFQITELDPGCTVTLYGASSEGTLCSSGTKATYHIGTCYSSSWMHYSIEGCRSSTLSIAATSSPTSTVAGQGRDREPRHDGIIAGSLVAAVSGAALIFTSIIVLMRRRPKEKYKLTQPDELSDECGLVETLSVEKQIPKELWADHAAVEIGRNSQIEPSVDCPLAKQRTIESQIVPQPVTRIRLAD